MRTTTQRREQFIIRADTTYMFALCRGHGRSHWWSQRAVCCTATDGLVGERSLGIPPCILLTMTPGQHHYMPQHTSCSKLCSFLDCYMKQVRRSFPQSLAGMRVCFSHRDLLSPCLSSASASWPRAVGWVARSHNRQQDRKCDFEVIKAEGSGPSIIFR